MKRAEELETKRSHQAVQEDLWSLIGGFGRYPAFLVAFMCYAVIVAISQHLILIYYGAPPNYQCVSNELNASSSWRINQCGCVNCTYVFMTDEFSSAVSEWNLMCDRAHLRAMTQSVYTAGYLFGSVGFGTISDHFGRKKATFISLFLMILFGSGSAFANSLTLFAVMRFGAGLATAGCMCIRLVYCLEISRLSHRTAIGNISNLFLTFGKIILTLVAYMIRDWRYLMLAISLPGVPLLLLWKWIPESFPWLIAKGRLQEAQEVLESFASASGVKVDSNQLASTIKEIKMADASAATEKNKAGILDLIKTPKMRKCTLILTFNWFVNSIVFYGIALNAKNLGGSFHLNVFILLLVGVPAMLFLWLLFKKCGRRLSYSTLMIFAGLVCLMVLAVPKTTGGNQAIKVLAVIGIFFINATFGGVNIYTSELSPTLLRNVAFGVGSMMARVGGIIAPYIVFLNDFLHNLPFIIFGVLALIAGIAALFLPETLYSPMPQTVDQVEAWDEDCGVPCRRKRRMAEEQEYMLKEGVQKKKLKKVSSDEPTNKIHVRLLKICLAVFVIKFRVFWEILNVFLVFWS